MEFEILIKKKPQNITLTVVLSINTTHPQHSTCTSNKISLLCCSSLVHFIFIRTVITVWVNHFFFRVNNVLSTSTVST